MAPAFTANLTEAQSGLWYAQQLDGNNPIYNTGHYIYISGKLNLPLFFLASQKTIAQAQVLALRFKAADAQPQQIYRSEQIPQLQLIDLRQTANAQQVALTQINQDLAHVRDLALEPLASFKLFCLSETEHIWFQGVHHLLTDGYGMLLFENQLAAHYNQLYAIEHNLPTKPVPALASYQAVIEADANYLRSAKRQTDKEFWLTQFQDQPELVPLREGIAVSAHDYLRDEGFYPEADFQHLSHYAQQHNLTWPDLVTALATVFLCRHSNCRQNIFGLPFMARLGQAAANIPAMVMNVLPLRVDYAEQDEISQFCLKLSQQMRKLRRHGLYRSEQLRRDLALVGSNNRLYGPIINVLPFDQPMQLTDLTTERQVLSTGPVDDLTITFRAHGKQQLILTIDANPKLYQRTEIQQLRLRLANFIRLCLNQTSFNQVPTVSADEWQQLIYQVNQTAHPVAKTTLTELIDSCIAKHPTQIALSYAGIELSYAEFAKRRDNLAWQLLAKGVTKQSIVALVLERSLEMVLALHAIIKIGAVYLPLDPTHPCSRLMTICNIAKPALLIGQTKTLTQLTDLTTQVKWLNLEEIDLITRQAPISAEYAPQPTDAAYIIFTSGSTGEPKGVVIEHSAIVNRLLWMQNHYQIGVGQRILQKTPYTFDVSVWEIFLPFICGATLEVAPPEAHKDPQQLLQLILTKQINILHFVPSMLAVFLSELNIPKQSSLQLVFCSGEALPASLRNQFNSLIDAELHNLYGPTEAAVDVSYWPAPKNDTTHPVPIGFPVWNTQLYVLDDNLMPTPPGVIGILYISGDQLARGYLGRQDLTDQRFMANPFIAGTRMYNTGDLAKRRADGAIEFLGRVDFQIKIRGLRIELDEIQSQISKLPTVTAAAVIARQEIEGQAYIAAYVVADTQLDFSQLTNQLKQNLPDYMLPAAWVQLDKLPISVNGKLNRKVLPIPEIQARKGKLATRPTQLELQAILADLLQYSAPIYLEDDFFALGGHSLLAARLVLRIKKHWGVEIGLGAIFEHSTLENLATLIEQLVQQDYATIDLKQQGMAAVINLQAAPTSQLPAIFCLHPAGGVSWCYARLARQLQQPARKVYGIQALTLDLNQSEPASLVAMAQQYVAEMRALQPQGPYHLVGWSVGGIIVQTMACLLQQQSQQVGLLALLDAYPSDIWRAKPEPAAQAACKAILLIAGFDPQDLPEKDLTQQNVIDFIRQRQHPLGSLPDELLAGIIRVVGLNNQLVRQHQQQKFNGSALFFSAALDHQGENLSPQLWQPYIDKLIIEAIPSLHGHMLTDDMAQLIAAKILSYLQQQAF